MAFSSTIKNRVGTDGLRHHNGTYTQTVGLTGGAIATGLARIESFQAIGATATSVSGGTVTITTAAAGGTVTEYWDAWGY